MDKSKDHNKAWLGIVLVIVGLAFLTDNFHFSHITIPHYIFSWEMLLIVIGGAMLVTGRRSGFVFLLIGGFFIAPDVLGFSKIYIRDWWPLILIAVGISYIMRRGNLSGHSGLTEGADFDVTSILGGRKHIVESDHFEGGKITSIFGGSEVDLTHAKFGDKPAVIDAFAICGGSTIIVPDDWKVEVKVTCILGGFSDSRRASSMESADPKKTLLIKGFFICGGGEIKSA